MDQEILVKQSQDLTKGLDQTKIAPKAVMLVVSEETGNCRLWIVPSDEAINKQEFYRIVAETISANGLTELDVGTVELAKSDNPAMQGMKSMFRIEGVGTARVSNNTFNGVLLPDGIVIRMML